MGLRYKKLLSEKRFLRVQERARKLMRDGSDLYAIYYKDKDLVFKTRSATDRRKVWTQRLRLQSVTADEVLSAKNFQEVETMIKEADLQIHCDCPAFTYWGYKYMAWRRGYGLVKELRRPKVKNRNQEGYLCYPKGSLVLTNKGYLPIESLKEGDLVFTHTGNLKPIVSTKVTKTDKITTLKIGRSTEIKSTPDHKHLSTIYNKDKKSFTSSEWIEAKDCSVSTYLNSTLLKLPTTHQFDPDLAWLLGLSYARGRFVKETITIKITHSELASYKHALLRKGFTNYKIVKSGVYTLLVFIEPNILSSLKDYLITDTIFEFIKVNKTAKDSFISGYFMGCGKVYTASNETVTVAFLWNKTNNKVMSLVNILLSENYFCKLEFNPTPTQLTIPYNASKEFFLNNVNELQYKGFNVSKFKFNTTVPKFNENYLLRVVNSNETKSKSCNVYSIEVADDHSFIVNGIITKNCKHLYLAVQLYPFWSRSLASKFRNAAENAANSTFEK